MADPSVNPAVEPWQEELTAMHRWGRFKFWFDQDHPEARTEVARLRELRQAAGRLDDSTQRLIEQVRSLEICNWRLEYGVIELCSAIGRRQPSSAGIGHLASMTDERWRAIWAYYLSLRKWLAGKKAETCDPMLAEFDPAGSTAARVDQLLGEPNELKRTHVERFSLTLDRWLGDYQPDSSRMQAHKTRVAAIDQDIARLDPEHRVLPEVVLKDDGDGRLNPCNHKLFYRYDLIISSIGVQKWRGAMGRRGTDGFARADILEKHLAPIQAWVSSSRPEPDDLSQSIHRSLGRKDDTKVFLASLLHSLLRSQQLAARKLAQTRSAQQ